MSSANEIIANDWVPGGENSLMKYYNEIQFNEG